MRLQYRPSVLICSVVRAVPLDATGRRDERFAADPEALIRHIILSPHYQVN